MLVHSVQFLALNVGQEMVVTLEIRLCLDGMEEIDEEFLSLVVPLALIPLGLIH